MSEHQAILQALHLLQTTDAEELESCCIQDFERHKEFIQYDTATTSYLNMMEIERPSFSRTGSSRLIITIMDKRSHVSLNDIIH